MRNFKKVVALVLALAMVFSMGTVAFAADSEADVLYDLGLFKGYSATEKVLGLEDASNAYQAIVLIGRALGWEVSMEAMVDFTDVPDYAVPYVAYAVAMGITNGVDATTFGDYVDGKRMATWTLRALGYGLEESWTDTDALAAAAGIEVMVDPITRASVVGVIYDTLMAMPVGSTMTVIEKLVEANPEMEAVAVAAGLIMATPDAIEVVSVTATNLKQLVVTFNTEIDEAGDEDNYAIVDDDDEDATIDEDSDFELSEDGTMVTITLTDAASQQDKIDLEITDIADEDVTIEDVEFLDITIPTADSAEAVGIDTIKVYFSEPMMAGEVEDKGNYEVEDMDGDTLYIKDVVIGSNNMSALVELYSDLDDDVVIEVSGVEDYQGFAALTTTLQVDVTVDNDAPVVIDYTDAEPGEVTLIFDGDIEVSDDDVENFYHTNTSNTVDEIEVDGNELTLIFAEGDEMPNGTAYVYIEEEVLNDLWDNDNDKIMVTVTVVSDTVAPSVVGDVDVTEQDEIEVTYDEDINLDNDDFEITVLDEDGDESDVTASGDIDADDGEILVITFSEDIYGDYSVVIEAMQDDEENEAADVTLAFFVEDETAPDPDEFTATLYKDDEDPELLVIDFDEEMDEASVTNKAMYYFGDSFDDDDVTITVINDGEAVEIEIEDGYIDIDEGDEITIGRVADAAGNLLDTLTASVTVVMTDDIEITSVELTDRETIVLTVEDEELVDVDAEAFEFFGLGLDGDGDAIEVSKVKRVFDDSDTEIIFSLSAELDMTDADGITYTVGADAATNEYDVVLEEVAVAAPVEDGAAPEVADDGIAVIVADADLTTGMTIVITFTEDLDEDTFAATGLNGFSVSGGDAELDSAELTGSNEVTLYSVDDEVFSEDTNVYYNDIFGIEDLEGNELADIEQTDELEIEEEEE